MHAYYQTHRSAPRQETLDRAFEMLAAQALFEGAEHPTHIRVAHQWPKIYIDLGDKSWRAVEITAQAFRVVETSPIKFIRPEGMQALPAPAPAEDGAALRELPQLLRLPDDPFSMSLLAGYLLGALNPEPSFPLLVLSGLQGSGKSTVAKAIRSLIDPHVVPLQAPPRSEQDLLIAASNSFCLAIDNVSWIRPEMADALCRLATGAGLRSRKLYTDRDETLLHIARPIILNGIEQFVDRPDLADRSIIVTLPPVSTASRVKKSVIEAELEAAKPRLLGALYAAASEALRNRHSAQLDVMPRMADFALWVKAAEGVLPFPPETFEEAYAANISDYAEQSAETDPVASRLLPFMAKVDGGTWEGSISDLLAGLRLEDDPFEDHPRELRNAKAFQGALTRAAPLLKHLGLEVSMGQKCPTTRRRLYRLRTLEHFAFQAHQTPNADDQAAQDDEINSWFDPDQMDWTTETL